MMLVQAFGVGDEPFDFIPRDWNASPRRVWGFFRRRKHPGCKKKKIKTKPKNAGPKVNLKVFTKSRAAKNNQLIF